MPRWGIAVIEACEIHPNVEEYHIDMDKINAVDAQSAVDILIMEGGQKITFPKGILDLAAIGIPEKPIPIGVGGQEQLVKFDAYQKEQEAKARAFADAAKRQADEMRRQSAGKPDVVIPSGPVRLPPPPGDSR